MLRLSRQVLLGIVIAVVCGLLIACGGGGGVSAAPNNSNGAGNHNNTSSDNNSGTGTTTNQTSNNSSTTNNGSSQSESEVLYLKAYSSDPLPSSTSLTFGVFSDELVPDGKYKTEACRNLHGDGSAPWVIKDISLPDPPSYLEEGGQARCCLMIWYDNDGDTRWNYQTEQLEMQVESNGKLLGLIYDGKRDPGDRWWVCYYDTGEMIKPANGESLTFILN